MKQISIYQMRNLVFGILLIGTVLFGKAQSVSLPQATISSAPFGTVENGGTGFTGFNFVEMSGVAVPATAFGMPNVTMSINFQYIELTSGDISLITGTILDYFTASYDSGTNILVFEQNAEIPADWLGAVEFPITVIQNSLQTEGYNGFNVNIAAIHGGTNAQGNASIFTYTENSLPCDIDCETDLSIIKTVNVESAIIGEEIEFTITVTNDGLNDASNIVIEEILPAGYEYSSHSTSQGDYNESDGLWNIPLIEIGNNETLIVVVKVLNITDYDNTARLIEFDQNDINDVNDNDMATVNVVLAGCLTIYNEFSPNNDGINDTFTIECIENYPNNTLEIYNRWGNILYRSKGYLNDWDGTSNGRVTINKSDKLPVGTYYYVLKLSDDSKPMVGWLYLKR